MNATLADRMKSYENINRTYLTERLPVIIRIDGKNFSRYTKPFKKPYDDIFLNAMRATAKKLCENVGGARLAYTQSDEISLLLVDYDTIDSQPWFGNNVQKLVSVTASMAAIYFYNALRDQVYEYTDSNYDDYLYIERLRDHLYKQDAVFDSRCFIIPKEEVVNYFRWRQIDCTRNSINTAAQTYLRPKEIKNKNCDQLQELLFSEAGINWAKYPAYFKNGSCVIKKVIEHSVTNPKTGENIKVTRPTWVEDKEVPIFTKDKDYIRQLVYPEWDMNS